MNNYTIINGELYHHGIKGMKWGVRRKSKVSEDSAAVKQIRKKPINQMSNKELKDANQRLQLETQYRDLSRKANAGRRAVLAFTSTAATIALVAKSVEIYQKHMPDTVKKALESVGNKVVNKIPLGIDLSNIRK